jgi:hypothetical protein
MSFGSSAVLHLLAFVVHNHVASHAVSSTWHHNLVQRALLFIQLVLKNWQRLLACGFASELFVAAGVPWNSETIRGIHEL